MRQLWRFVWDKANFAAQQQQKTFKNQNKTTVSLPKMQSDIVQKRRIDETHRKEALVVEFFQTVLILELIKS